MPRSKGGPALKLVYDFSGVEDILVPYRRLSKAKNRKESEEGSNSIVAQKTKIGHGLAFRDQSALNWDCFDDGKTGENLQRPGLQKALAHVYAGEASGIICAKLDRLSRDLLDFATLMDKANKEGWNIVLLDVGVDLRQPVGKLMAGILALFAQFERDMIIQRTNDGLAERKADGVRLGRKRSLSDELLAAVIGTYHVEGSFSGAARFLNAAGASTPQGGKQWYPATIQKIVQSQDGRAFVEALEAA